MTRQRSAVRAALERSEGFRSAQEIYADLRTEGTAIGLTTVYRALAGLAEAGEVDVLRSEDGESVYRRCSPVHHHHLVCRSCGRTVEVADRAVERWAARVAEAHGFREADHTVEVSGVCPACASA